ncbi:cell wall hydrolase [Niallia oryzisoli]|uniref:Cell wall hydrolase n=1 Tax=Niallia oryzisoli TaxID=1737571 RepID=A0ABZ2CMB7_9BACI
MKNTYMKTFITACAAVFAIIGVNNTMVEAITEDRNVNGDTLLELGQQDGVKAENGLSNDLILIDDILQIPEPQTSVLPMSTLKQKKVDQQIEPKEEIKEAETVEPAISLSNEEKDLFARLVEAEAKGEPYEGKVAVATVVLNRVESPEFPDTVTNVINEVVGNAYAFSPVQNGEINKPASDDSIRAVEEALTRKDRLQDCIFFYNPEIATDTWIRSREVVTTIGNHVFAK